MQTLAYNFDALSQEITINEEAGGHILQLWHSSEGFLFR